MRKNIRIKPDSKAKPLQAASMGFKVALRKGFTTIELMVVVAIMGIIGTIAIPAFQDWMTHSEVNNTAATIMSKLKQARNMAVAENRNITVSFDSARNIFIYDVYAYAPKVAETIDLKQFSKTLIFRKNRQPNIIFTSLGTIQGQVTTIKVLKDNYYQCITVNLIGRSYLTSMVTATATCKGL